MANGWNLRMHDVEGVIQHSFDAGMGDGNRQKGNAEPEKLGKELDKLRPKASGLLPPMVRWVSSSGHYAILERPPHRRRIAFCNTTKGRVTAEKTTIYDVAIPWSVYAVGFQHDDRATPTLIYVYFAPHQLQSNDDMLFLPPLSNVYGDGRFCLPNTSALKPTLGGGLQAAVEVIWSSGFNLDMHDAVSRCINSKKPSIFFDTTKPARSVKAMMNRWSKLSMAEVLAIDDWYPPATYNQVTTVGGLIQMFEGYGQSINNANMLISNLRTALQKSAVIKPAVIAPEATADQPTMNFTL